jgi:hypothetical protein
MTSTFITGSSRKVKRAIVQKSERGSTGFTPISYGAPIFHVAPGRIKKAGDQKPSASKPMRRRTHGQWMRALPSERPQRFHAPFLPYNFFPQRHKSTSKGNRLFLRAYEFALQLRASWSRHGERNSFQNALRVRTKLVIREYINSSAMHVLSSPQNACLRIRRLNVNGLSTPRRVDFKHIKMRSKKSTCARLSLARNAKRSSAGIPSSLADAG